MSTSTAPAKPHTLSFEEWYELNEGLFENLDELDCLKCDGDGTVACGECDQDKPCEACDGAGFVLPTEEHKRRYAKDFYIDQLKADLKKWEEWAKLSQVPA